MFAMTNNTTQTDLMTAHFTSLLPAQLELQATKLQIIHCRELKSPLAAKRNTVKQPYISPDLGPS